MPILKQLLQGRARLLLTSTLLALACNAAMSKEARQATDRVVALSATTVLAQTGKYLELRHTDGTTTGHLAMRAEHVDARYQDNQGLAIAIDRDTRQVVPIQIDLKKGLLTGLPPLDLQGLAVESVCMHQDQQGLLHAFVIGREGVAQQWILDGSSATLLRQLALAPGVESCRADDVSGSLFLIESGVGVWAYGITQDAPIQRELIAHVAPKGRAPSESAQVATWPHGVAVLSDSGTRLLRWSRASGHWRAMEDMPLPSKADAVAIASHSGQTWLQWREAATRTWHRAKLRGASSQTAPQRVATVLPTAQTDSVQSSGDAADDPAIWVHPTRPGESRLLGTNKKRGLDVYAMDGQRLQSLPVGRINNIDLRQGIALGGAQWDIAVASNRSDNSMTVFTIAADGVVQEAARLQTGLDEVYGICLYKPNAGGLHVIINDKDGRFKQFALSVSQGKFDARLLRSFSLNSQPEGCVVDDQADQLYFGEEHRGVWVMSADSSHVVAPRLIAKVGAQLVADVEGMGLFKGRFKNYLLVSSQGDHSYLVLEAKAPYRVAGKFRIGINLPQRIDAVSETDGLDVTSASLGGVYSSGALIVQDGYKRMPEAAQNFKLVPWSDIAQALNLSE